MLMRAHILFDKIDKKWPATLSSIWHTFLREKLKYKGLIVSDDLEMGALTRHYTCEEIAVQALLAGCQILLYCHTLQTPRIAFDAVEKAAYDGKISLEWLERNYKTLLQLKKTKLSLPPSWPEVQHRIGAPAHQELAEKIKQRETSK